MGILLSSDATRAWHRVAEQKRPNIINDLGARVMAVTLSLDSDNNGKTVDVFIVSSYAPTSTHSEVEWEAYYDALSAALARRPPNAIVIIGADTNASIGRGNLSDNDNDIESLCFDVVGSFGIERINDAGRWLRVFMETHQIAALSTFFNKKYYSTWWTHQPQSPSASVRTKSTTFSLSVKTCVTI